MAHRDPREIKTHKEAGEKLDVLADGYRAMAADREREQTAEEWSEALIGDSSEAP